MNRPPVIPVGLQPRDVTRLAASDSRFVRHDHPLAGGWDQIPVPLWPYNSVFGGQVFDPARGKFVYYAASSSTSAGVTKQQSNRGWIHGTSSIALALGAPSSIDEAAADVPYVWHEPERAAIGQRPWIMVYRAAESGTVSAPAIATSADGVTWERKYPDGTAATTRITDAGGTANDHGCVFFDSHSGLYYLYYNTIANPGRRIGLTTSPDLKTWTEYNGGLAGGAADAVLFSGVATAGGDWDYEDRDHDAAAVDTSYGWFCPWVGRWDLADGTPRYAMVVPSYTKKVSTLGRESKLHAFTSASPLFTKQNRIYHGVAVTPFGLSIEGVEYVGDTMGMDTPRLLIGDRRQGIHTASVGRSPVVRMVATLVGVPDRASDTMLVRRMDSLSGATYSGCSQFFPINEPVVSLTPSADSNTALLLLPGKTGTLYDYASGYHALPLVGDADADGLLLRRADSEYARYLPGAALTAINAITGDYTIEFTASLGEARATGEFAIPVAVQTNQTTGRWAFVYLNGNDGGSYYLSVRHHSSIAIDSDTFTWTVGRRHKWAITREGSVVRFWRDGVKIGADKTAAAAITGVASGYTIGTDHTVANRWDGHIDEVRISNVARYSAAYTPTDFALQYGTASPGYVYSRVLDFGEPILPRALVDAVTPSGTELTVYFRAASNIDDSSSEVGDFLPVQQFKESSRFVQAAIAMTTEDASQTPVVRTFDVLGSKP